MAASHRCRYPLISAQKHANEILKLELKLLGSSVSVINYTGDGRWCPPSLKHLSGLTCTEECYSSWLWVCWQWLVGLLSPSIEAASPAATCRWKLSHGSLCFRYSRQQLFTRQLQLAPCPAAKAWPLSSASVLGTSVFSAWHTALCLQFSKRSYVFRLLAAVLSTSHYFSSSRPPPPIVCHYRSSCVQVCLLLLCRCKTGMSQSDAVDILLL